MADGSAEVRRVLSRNWRVLAAASLSGVCRAHKSGGAMHGDRGDGGWDQRDAGGDRRVLAADHRCGWCVFIRSPLQPGGNKTSRSISPLRSSRGYCRSAASCPDQSIGRSMRASCRAVSDGDWRPVRIAASIAGLRKASGRMRPTSARSTPNSLAISVLPVVEDDVSRSS